MHKQVCYIWLTRLYDGIHYFILHVPARPFSGLFGKADPPPINLTTFWCGWICTLGVFSFKRWVVRHLGYLIFLASQMCPIWKISWDIRFILEGPILALLCTIRFDGFQGVWCIRKFPHSTALLLLVGFLFQPRVFPEILNGSHSVLRPYTVLGGYQKFLEYLKVLSISSFPSDRVLSFP